MRALKLRGLKVLGFLYEYTNILWDQKADLPAGRQEIPRSGITSALPPRVENHRKPRSGIISLESAPHVYYRGYETGNSRLHEVLTRHSYSTPEIIAIPTAHRMKKYYDWLLSELV